MHREDLTVVSFNVRGAGKEKDGINHWTKRKKLNVQTIKFLNPDLMGLQEAQYGNLATYHDHLRQEYHHILGNNIDFGNFNPIFWKPNRLAMAENGAFWLHPSELPNTRATAWNSSGIRSATWAVLRDQHSGKETCMVNVHLDNVSDVARIEGAKMVLRKLTEIGEDLPTVITGDFNSNRYVPLGLNFLPPYTDNALLTFEQAGFTDTYAKFYEDGPHSNTFHNFEGNNYDPKNSHGIWRVDWILARNLDVLGADIIKAAKVPLYPSDHYPISARVKHSI